MKGNKKPLIAVIFASVLSWILTVHANSGGGASGGASIWMKVLAIIVAEFFRLLSNFWIIDSARIGILFLEGIIQNIDTLLTTSPAISEIFGGMIFFMKMVLPFYIIAITFIALYLMMSSSSPTGRAKAKSMLMTLIIGLVLVLASPGILGIMFLISEFMSKSLMLMGAQTGVSVLSEASGAHESLSTIFKCWPVDLSNTLFGWFQCLNFLEREGAIHLYNLNITLMLGLVLVLLLRHVMVFLFGMLLPLAFFFYFFRPTKHIGKDIFIQIILWTFAPVAWAFSLVVIGELTQFIPDYIPHFYVLIAAFFFFLGSPMLILGVADWLSFMVLFFEILAIAPLSIGAVVVDETMK